MKKIFMIFAAMAAVLSSCQKSELESVSVNDGKDIVLNISVSNPGADDTKALIKTGWAANDEISIWYDGNNDAIPDLVIKHDGSKWIQKQGVTVSGKKPSTGDNKYAKALYKGTVKVASKDDYTYDGKNLTFKIEHWVFLTEVQVVVYGDGIDATKPGKYTLACDKFTPITGNGYTVESDAITASTGTEGDAVTGISNADGVAFVFATADYSTSSTDKKDFKFILTDETSGSKVAKIYKPSVAIAPKEGKSSIKALRVAKIKFGDPPCPAGFVDMGVKNALGFPVYWRTMNLGATTVASSTETCYGNLYSWGEVETKTDYSKSKYTDDAKAIDNATNPWDKTKHDAAYKESDGAWRMPTSAEFQALADACGGRLNYNASKNPGKDTSVDKGIYWCTDYDGVAGCLFCNGTNKLFFPAAGYSNGSSLSDGGIYGNYWSSTLKDGEYAYALSFNKESAYPQQTLTRYFGRSVRPVSDRVISEESANPAEMEEENVF